MTKETKLLLVCLVGIMINLMAFMGLTIYGDYKKAHQNNETRIVNVKTENKTVINFNNTTKPVKIDRKSLELKKQETIQSMVEISSNRISITEATEIYNACQEFSKKENIRLEVILGIAAQESNFVKTRNSYKGASYGRGLMQISDVARQDFYWKTGKNYTAKDCYDISKSIEMACWIYKQNIKYGIPDDEKSLIIAYNTGHGMFKRMKSYLLNNTYPNGSPYNYYKNVISMF